MIKLTNKLLVLFSMEYFDYVRKKQGPHDATCKHYQKMRLGSVIRKKKQFYLNQCTNKTLFKFCLSQGDLVNIYEKNIYNLGIRIPTISNIITLS